MNASSSIKKTIHNVSRSYKKMHSKARKLYKKLSELRFSRACGTWPVILLKLKSIKFNLANREKFTDARLSDTLQFLKIRVFKDVMLLMNASEELPLSISPIRLHHKNR